MSKKLTQTMTAGNAPVVQSSLGDVRQASNAMDKIMSFGSMDIGRVMKVHYKRGTADVAIEGMGDVIMSSDEQEGQNSCIISTRRGGVDSEFGCAFGESVPLNVGDKVLVAYINNNKKRPVILCVLHDISEEIGEYGYNNILPVDCDNWESPYNNREMYRYTNVSRIQDVITVDGYGHFEISSHTKAFLMSMPSSMDADSVDYEDLSTKNKKNGKTVYVRDRESAPMKYALVFRDDYDDDETNYLRATIDAQALTLNIMRQDRANEKLTQIKIGEDGRIQLRRQKDTWRQDGNIFSQIEIAENGDITLEHEQSSIRIERDAIYIDAPNVYINCGNTRGKARVAKAARIVDESLCPSDSHGNEDCPHVTQGPAVEASETVFANGYGMLRKGDTGEAPQCCGPGEWQATEGSETVIIEGRNAVREGDKTEHCGGEGTIISGSPDVQIGG